MTTGIESIILSLCGDRTQEIEDVLTQLRTRLDIDLMSGDNLDRIGLIVGQGREGFLDAKYRRFIRAKIIANTSESDAEAVIEAWAQVTGATLVGLVELFPGSINLYADVEVPAADFTLILNIIGDVVAAGVAVDGFGVIPEATTFGFSPTSAGFSSDGSTGGGPFYEKQYGS